VTTELANGTAGGAANGEAAPTRVVVIGAGPGGYPAAFQAAHLGMDVTLVDPEPNPGGVCLYRGCIPSKALLHVASLLNETEAAGDWGIHFERPAIDVDQVRDWKGRVVAKMTGGLGVLTKQRRVRYLQGRARLTGPTQAVVELVEGGEQTLEFDYAVLATGSRPAVIPSLLPESPLVMDSTSALELPEVPATLLVVGGGYIGLELGSVYAALGSRVTVVEMTAGLLPGADRDLVQQLERRLKTQLEEILLETRVESMREVDGSIEVTLAGADVEQPVRRFDRALVSVGRRPNSEGLGLESTRVRVNQRGFIEVDAQRRTAEPTIFAVGDVAGEPMLAHKATHEGRVAAEAIAGQPVAFDPAAIPAVVFTDPEIAWSGLTESEARERGIVVDVLRFPWAASGRATTLGRANEGVTKLLVDPRSERVLGVGIAGAGAGELIAEATLAIEMGARVEDLRATIHAHPTLSETLMESADLFTNSSPHYIDRRRERARGG
jgi:dihydrolipoamide dehydrogenase